jgi:hypothetical protein
MRNTYKAALILSILLSACLTPAVTQAQIEKLVFNEDFNDIDPNKWTVETKGYGGRVTVADSAVYLSSYGTSFPLIYPKVNPIPDSGDFIVEFTIQYTNFGVYGSGFWISSGDFVIQEGVDMNANILEVWGGASQGEMTLGATLFQSLAWRATVSNFYNSLDFKLEYISGVYSLYLNGQLLLAVTSTVRADSIGFGHPAAPYLPQSQPDQWTSFKVDAINIFQETKANSTETPFFPTPNQPSAVFIITLAGIIVASIILTSLVLLIYQSTKANSKKALKKK